MCQEEVSNSIFILLPSISCVKLGKIVVLIPDLPLDFFGEKAPGTAFFGSSLKYKVTGILQETI